MASSLLVTNHQLLLIVSHIWNGVETWEKWKCKLWRPISVLNPYATDMRLSIIAIKTEQISQWHSHGGVEPMMIFIGRDRGAGGALNNLLICIVILQLIVHLKGLLTMFSLCLMDLSYLILKETTADHRTVRTQHILETTHNDDEF